MEVDWGLPPSYQYVLENWYTVAHSVTTAEASHELTWKPRHGPSAR
jgi:hypothetical protein